MDFFTIPELGPPKKIQIEPLLGCTPGPEVDGSKVHGSVGYITRQYIPCTSR